MSEKVTILKETALFSALTETELQSIATFSHTLQLAPSEGLFEDGETAHSFYVVVSGQLKVYKTSPEGKEQILHFQRPGDLVAEAAIFDKETYPAGCQALKEASVLQINKQKFVDFILANPGVSLRLLASYSSRLRGFVSLVEDLSLNDVKKRLAKYLLDTSAQEPDGEISLAEIPKKDLASLVGTTPESLSRTLKLFKTVGWIREKGKHIQLIDRPALEAILG